jgi:hypothetical protein
VYAIRYHAHLYGIALAAYRVRGGVDWTELGIGDPQWPQTFYPTKSVFELKEGDMLVGMCTYRNDGDRLVQVGQRHIDEMCNIFLMYYTSNRSGARVKCIGSEDPKLEANIPDSASVRPPPLFDNFENVIHS